MDVLIYIIKLTSLLLTFFSLSFSQRDIAIKFLEHFNVKYASISAEEYEAMYRRATNITDHNLNLQNEANEKLRDEIGKLLSRAKTINLNDSDANVKRQFRMLLTSMTASNRSVANRVSEILTNMENIYNTGSVPSNPKIKSIKVDGITELSLDGYLRDIMTMSNDTDELLYAWKAWRDAVGPKVRYVGHVLYHFYHPNPIIM